MEIKSISFDFDRTTISTMEAINQSMTLWNKTMAVMPAAPSSLLNQLILGELDMKDLRAMTYQASSAYGSTTSNQPSLFGLSLVIYKGRDRHWELATDDVDPPTYDTQRLKQENKDLRAQVKNLNGILTD